MDLNSLEEADSVLGLLLSLFGKTYLGCLVGHELTEQMFSAMQSADAITAMASQLEKLPPKSRELFKKLLRFFSKVSQREVLRFLFIHFFCFEYIFCADYPVFR